jgi:hypothetical protein
MKTWGLGEAGIATRTQIVKKLKKGFGAAACIFFVWRWRWAKYKGGKARALNSPFRLSRGSVHNRPLSARCVCEYEIVVGAHRRTHRNAQKLETQEG